MAESDGQFGRLAALLDAIAAKRHVALPTLALQPFGLGADRAAPASHADRCVVAISHCAKTTPYLRRVAVACELWHGGRWQPVPRVAAAAPSPVSPGPDADADADGAVDRIGVAVYRSAPKAAVLGAGGPEAVRFAHDPYARFARVTLRFGPRPLRTYLDIEHDGGDSGSDGRAPCYVARARRGCSVLYLPCCRVRTCDGSELADAAADAPLRTAVRLVFRDRARRDGWIRSRSRSSSTGSSGRSRSCSAGGGGGGSGGSEAEAEAEKAARLVRRAVRLAVRSPLGIPAAVRDADIHALAVKGVVSARGYTVRNAADGHSFTADIRAQFDGCTLYLVPAAAGRGIVLVSHSRDGEAVLRQPVAQPAALLAAVGPRGFDLADDSLLVRARDGSRSFGCGLIRYAFLRDADAAVFAAMLALLAARPAAAAEALTPLASSASASAHRRTASSPALSSPSASASASVSARVLAHTRAASAPVSPRVLAHARAASVPPRVLAHMRAAPAVSPSSLCSPRHSPSAPSPSPGSPHSRTPSHSSQSSCSSTTSHSSDTSLPAMPPMAIAGSGTREPSDWDIFEFPLPPTDAEPPRGSLFRVKADRTVGLGGSGGCVVLVGVGGPWGI